MVLSTLENKSSLKELIFGKKSPCLKKLTSRISGTFVHIYFKAGIFSLSIGTGVLVLAGVHFIFFIVASMGLCFGFVLESVLIIQGCFSYC